MHELSITENILRTCLSQAEKHNLKKIESIYLKTGLFSGIDAECIQMYMDIISEGTAAEGARIHSESIPVKLKCSDCGNEIETLKSIMTCPSCGSRRLKAVSGTEFLIAKIEGE